MTRPQSEVDLVQKFASNGLSQSAISRQTGIPRPTIHAWLKGRVPSRAHQADCFRCVNQPVVFRDFTASAYVYLLGLYLGDGCLAAYPRGVFRLGIYMDRAYPRILAECEAAMALAMPSSRVSLYHHPHERVSHVLSYSQHWPCLLPQHGPGRKHERDIALADWQRAIVNQHPGRFLRGLIHSDGSRSLNLIRHPRKTYVYPRYAFSNRSTDIRGLFCEYCDKLGIEWRQMNQWTISVARRESVARMDRLVGAKQ